jgi:hypothetical protein
MLADARRRRTPSERSSTRFYISQTLPALERCHRRLARRLIAVRGAADVAVVAARPHPLSTLRRCGRHEDAADNGAVLQHVVVVLAPFDRTSAKSMRA